MEDAHLDALLIDLGLEGPDLRVEAVTELMCFVFARDQVLMQLDVQGHRIGDDGGHIERQCYHGILPRLLAMDPNEHGWHDLFNALAWLAFPRTKARLNAMHAAEIPAEGGRPRRAQRGEHRIAHGVANSLLMPHVFRYNLPAMPERYAEMAVAEAPRLQPTEAQAGVIRELVKASRTRQPGTFLLRGVTGSGKTLVYIELLREVVDRQGKTAIVLVPEIALTPQTVGRFKAVFGDRVAVLHSALSEGERYDEWRSLRAGEKRIVVGARSAIFAPLDNLGAVIVDEEHEGSYKQAEAPRYHAREVAVVRATIEGAVCLLGSATPSLESWVNARAGKYALVELPERVGGQPMPPIRVVDLRAERKRVKKTTGPLQEAAPVILSDILVDAVRERIKRAEQTILLLNRRGYATFVQCRECGQVWHCPQCNVSLTFHRRRALLTCHYCLHEEAAPKICSACGSDDLSFRGVGTEQVERAVEEAFPAARIARMDVDTTAGKWAHHTILGKVERGEVDILLGTQMIAKGLDFPNVTLVGVINADTGINLPDFRATERTFQLLTQVAGRAGRGPKGGEVFIQTALPHHYAVESAMEHDFVGKLVGVNTISLKRMGEFEDVSEEEWRAMLRRPRIPSVIIETHHALDFEEVARWREERTLEAFAAAVAQGVVDAFAPPPSAPPPARVSTRATLPTPSDFFTCRRWRAPSIAACRWRRSTASSASWPSAAARCTPRA